MAVVLLIFMIVFAIALGIIRIILAGLYIVARCIVLTIKNEIEEHRLRKEWREAQRANQDFNS